MSDVAINFTNEFYAYVYTYIALLIISFAILTFGLIKWRKRFITIGLTIFLLTLLTGVITFYY
jgi:hypothetical protein